MSWNNIIPAEVLLKRQEDIEECQKLVAEFFEKDIVRTSIWFSTKNPMLGNISPNEMIVAWREQKLLKWIKTQLKESKPCF